MAEDEPEHAPGILVIDGQEANRAYLGRLLKRGGYRMIEAGSWREGRRLLAAKPDVIILDIGLPDASGYEVCEQLKVDPDTAAIPVLMTSASFTKGLQKAQGLDSGADAYLTAPADPQELTATIRSLLRARDAEAKLRKSQEMFITLADSIPAMVWMAGARGKCYYFNKAWLSFTGRAFAAEVQKWDVGIHPDDYDHHRNVYDLAFRQRQAFEITYRLLRYDGEYRWVIDRGEPHYDLFGEFAGFTGACIDIHDKLQAENRLKDSEERFELALKGMNDGLWDFDPVRRTVYLAPRYKALLGYTDAEYPDSADAWSRDLHPDDRDATMAHVVDYLDGREDEYKNFFRLRHKDGRYRWFMSRGIAVRNEQGQAIRFVGAITDMTEQKEMEEELREAKRRAESANTAKTEFLANVSHEMRTPMNVIIGLSGILSRTGLNEKQKQFVATLQSSADSLLTIINDMLDIAKIEDNMMELESLPFSVGSLMDRVISMMSVRANEKGLDLTLDYAGQAPEWYIGDPTKLQQIVLNLVGNAIKFTQKGGISITVSSHAHERTGFKNVSIAVSDTGIGIAEDKIAHVFEKFTQGDSTITRKYGGSGLGLSIVRALVDRMGGHIDVKSVVGKGSTFTVTLPLPVAEAEAEEIRKDQGILGNPASKGMILLVDDYSPNVMIVSTLLSDYGYDHDVAVNGIEAVEKFAQGKYDAVIMDVQMQGMDGYEATRRIRTMEKERGKAHLPIIAMTAHALPGDREKCLNAGMDDYISKPFRAEDLKSRLEAFLNPAHA